MKSIAKKTILFIIIFLIIVFIKSNVYAASVNISAPSTVNVGENCTITITGSGAATYDIVANISGAGISEKIYLNAYTDDLQNASKSASKTITPSSAGKITISIDSGSNVTISGASGSQSITGSSKTITVNEKKVETPATLKTPQTTPTNPSNNVSNKSTTTTKTDTKKETKVEETKEDDFYISKLSLKGIKESEEKVEIALSPEFNANIYEYSCVVASDIKKIELEKDAGNYTNSIIESGLENLKEGENIITLQLLAEEHKAKTYTIKVIKENEDKVVEAASEIEEEQEENSNKEDKKVMVCMPLWAFSIMQIVIVIVEIAIIYFVIKKKMLH